MDDISETEPVDLFVIGGGINGCGIARDAAGRGLSVTLAEMNDLASATSSASTKLFHGGLRYLEFFEFRLVREALVEREVLLRAMPHISWPMRFVLPYHPDMRFESETPTSKLLTFVMPWMKGRRPRWLIRLGLFLYDNIGGRKILPGTRTIDLTTGPEGAPLDDRFRMAYEYSDCWVEDSRLVVLNARDAAARGATIMTRTCVIGAERQDGVWVVEVEEKDTGTRRRFRAKMLVNAGGPWVGQTIRQVVRSNSAENVRLVRGSHIVTRRLFDHDKCYFFQGEDGRIIFAIPYEGDYTLIGTTDSDHSDPGQKPECTPEEARYLREFASAYFKVPVTEADVVWTYSGVRPLYDDGASSATAATRDYVLKVDEDGGAPLLNVFGGKITTYRRLAEAALDKIGAYFPGLSGSWTEGAAMPGGDFPVDGFEALVARFVEAVPAVPPDMARRLVRAYGTDVFAMFEAGPGASVAPGVFAPELDWVIDREWVREGEDYLWRRTKMGLRLSAEEAASVAAYIDDRVSGRMAAAAE